MVAVERSDRKKAGQTQKGMEILALLLLFVYSMRHISWGLDFWDTGYSYANFEYMGTEHMDPMWLFSTYLANGVGHVLTLLPFGRTLLGMNFYTGLFAGFLAIAGYLFCTRGLKISRLITFVGEFIALNLCWCPTAVLYNYLTYVLLLLCVVLLYLGLIQDKRGYLYAAGLCLGANVLVRFSNLPEAALIVAVWAYGVIEWLEERKSGAFKRTIRRTMWCMGGYVTSLVILMGYIHIRYGLDHYAAGIQRLFAMTDSATDYKAGAMLTSLVDDYLQNMYWMIRILFIVAVGVVCFGAAAWFLEWIRKRKEGLLWTVLHFGWCGVAGLMLFWLYYRGFFSTLYYTYGPIRRPGILFLMLTMGIALIRIFYRHTPKEEKLISGLVLLTVLITSVGSNNKSFPSLNNLFVAAPYTLWECERFVRNGRDRKWKRITFCPFPAKAILCAFLAMFMVNSVLFGMVFMFAESTGVQDVTAKVENNQVLKGIRMSPERAEWMTEISAYVEEQGLTGQDVLLYGGVPALSYYLQMPSAFNPWSDLASYRPDPMRLAMEEMYAEMEADASYRPVVMLENKYAWYLERNQGKSAAEADGNDSTGASDGEFGQEVLEAIESDEKWQMIQEFLEEYGYEQTFRNKKVGIWECR